MAQAKLIHNKEKQAVDAVIFTNDSGQTIGIPFDPANTDAKEFAKWLAEGGVPEAAVEGETVSAEWIAETIAKLS
jgi:hypothetical protein